MSKVPGGRGHGLVKLFMSVLISNRSSSAGMGHHLLKAGMNR
jgi:hypothetical protein